MTKRDLWSTAIKLFLSYQIFAVPISIAYYYRFFSGWTILFFGIIFVVVLLVLAKLSDWIAKIFVPVDSEIHISGIAELPKAIFMLALRIIGVLFILDGFTGMIHMFIVSGAEITSKKVIEGILYLIFGFYMLAGAKLLTQFLFKQGIAKSIEPMSSNNPTDVKEVNNE